MGERDGGGAGYGEGGERSCFLAYRDAYRSEEKGGEME